MDDRSSRLYKTCLTCRLYRIRVTDAKRNKSSIHAQTDTTPCVYCGKYIQWGMDYHHRNQSTKVASVTSLRGKRRAAELLKCDRICAMCHCEQTNEQRAASRKSNDECSFVAAMMVYDRNHEFVKKQKLRDEGCKLCGLTIEDTLGLFNYFEYDHMDPTTKHSAISRMCSQRLSIGTIMQELAKCRLLCRPCHRKHSAFTARKDSLIVHGHEQCNNKQRRQAPADEHDSGAVDPQTL
jgi:hypothetical protein